MALQRTVRIPSLLGLGRSTLCPSAGPSFAAGRSSAVLSSSCATPLARPSRRRLALNASLRRLQAAERDAAGSWSGAEQTAGAGKLPPKATTRRSSRPDTSWSSALLEQPEETSPGRTKATAAPLSFPPVGHRQLKVTIGNRAGPDELFISKSGHQSAAASPHRRTSPAALHDDDPQRVLYTSASASAENLRVSRPLRLKLRSPPEQPATGEWINSGPGSRLRLTNIKPDMPTADVERALRPHLAGERYKLFRNSHADSGVPTLFAFLHLPSVEAAEAVKASVGKAGFILIDRHPVYVATASGPQGTGPRPTGSRPTELRFSDLPSKFPTERLATLVATALGDRLEQPPVVRRGHYESGMPHPFALVELASVVDAARVKDEIERDPQLTRARLTRPGMRVQVVYSSHKESLK